MSFDLGETVIYKAGRSLCRAHRFVTASIIFVALSTGIATAGFNVLYEASIRSLPFSHPEALNEVFVAGSDSRCTTCVDLLSYSAIRELSSKLPPISAFASYRDLRVSMANDSLSDVGVRATMVDSSFFDVLSPPIVAGRRPTSDDFASDQRVVILSAVIWRRYFGQSRDIVGQSVRLDGETFAIIGVVPDAAVYPRGTDIWIPLTASFRPSGVDDAASGIIARLRAGMTTEAVNQWFAANRSAILSTAALPSTSRLVALGLEARERQAARSQSVLIVGVITVVLLLGFGNLSVLFVVRWTAKAQEIAIRRALGAPLYRIAQHAAAEGLVVGIVGSCFGLGLALALVHVGSVVLTPEHDSGGFGLASLTFCAGLSILVLTICTTAAVAPVRTDRIHNVLQAAQSNLTLTRSRLNIRSALVVCEVASGMALMVGAVLLTRSFLGLERLDLGYRASDLYTIDIRVKGTPLESPDISNSLASSVARRLAQLPGVQGAASWSEVHTRRNTHDDPITLFGQTQHLPYAAIPISSIDATPGFFEAVGLRLVRGRSFTNVDNATSEPVVVVNEIAANRLWPGQDPLGRRLKLGPADSAGEWMTVIGVVSNSAPIDPLAMSIAVASKSLWPLMFRPLAQTKPEQVTFVIRTNAPSAALLNHFADVVREEAHSTVRPSMQSYRNDLLRGYEQIHRSGQAMLALGAIAVLLALGGVYAVIYDTLQRRTREIGVRLALGAQPSSMRRLLLLNAARFGGIGVAVGTIAAVAVMQLLRGMLFQTQALGPIVFAGCGAAMLSVTMIASALPAHMAGKVDPMVALRHD